MKTYLSKETLATLNTEEEVAVYTALKMEFDQMLTQVKDVVEVKIDADILNYDLFGSFDTTRYDKTKLETGLNKLINSGLVKILAVGSKGRYVLDVANLAIKDEETYTMMDREEIWKITNIPFKQKFNLLRFAITIFGTLNNAENEKYYKCGFSSLETLMELSHIKGKETGLTLYKLLEENDIIYIRHSDKYTVDGDTVKNVSNIYGRPCDRVYADNYYEDRFNKKSDDRSTVEVLKDHATKQQKPVVKQETVEESPVDKYMREEAADKARKEAREKELAENKNTTPASEPAKEAVTTGITTKPITYTDAQKEVLRKMGITPDDEKPKMTKEQIINIWDDDEEQADFEGFDTADWA